MNRAPAGEYWDFSWNPVTGCLFEGECREYCHCRPIARRFGKTEDERNFKPAFHPERLEEPLRRKIPARIFVCLNGDLWGEWVPRAWIIQVLGIVRKAVWHRFIFLTKNPARYYEFDLPLTNAIYGTTVSDLEKDRHRARMLAEVKDTIPELNIWTSFEPIRHCDDPDVILNALLDPAQDWAAIGLQTGPRKPHKIGLDGFLECPPEQMQALERHSAIEVSRYLQSVDVPVWQKNNLRLDDPIQQLPEILKLPHEKEEK